MTTLDELLRVRRTITTVHVEHWVERGLLRPTAEGEAWIFEPVDVARAGLLADLSEQMGFDDEAVETVVGLLDQVHTLRRQLDQQVPRLAVATCDEDQVHGAGSLCRTNSALTSI